MPDMEIAETSADLTVTREALQTLRNTGEVAIRGGLFPYGSDNLRHVEHAIEVADEALAEAKARAASTPAEPVTLIVTGASDDLIEVEGAIREEFSASTYASSEVDGDLLSFSDGTVLRIEYDRDGVWRIVPVTRGTAELAIVQAPAGDEDNYSDKATLTGDVRWVMHGKNVAHAKGSKA